MTIDPRVGFYLSIALAVIGVAAASGTQLTTIFGEHTANIILAVAVMILAAGNAINAILHAIPSGNTPADAAKFALGPKPAAVVVLFLLAGLGLLFSGQPASAQVNKTANVSSFATFVTNLAAIDEAITLSIQIPTLQDPIGNSCWTQMKGLQALIKAHPSPLTFKVAADWEAARLLAIAAQQICTNPSCGQMWADAQNAVAAVSNAPIPFSMTSFCSKVPAIATSLTGAAAISVPAPPIPSTKPQ